MHDGSSNYKIPIYVFPISDVLTNDGHTVELRKIPYWNFVELQVNGEKVFKCDIRDLDYGKCEVQLSQAVHEEI